MRRLPRRRVPKSLVLGLCLTVFAAGPVRNVGSRLVLAADGPSGVSSKSDAESREALETVKASSSDGAEETAPARIHDSTSGHLQTSRLKGPDVDLAAGILGIGRNKAEFQVFRATAYCLKGKTASGVYTRRGIIAADPRLLPLGTIVQIEAGSYSGTYTVLDTGGRIKGRSIDIYVPTYREAVKFGRQRVKLKVIKRKPLVRRHPASAANQSRSGFNK